MLTPQSSTLALLRPGFVSLGLVLCALFFADALPVHSQGSIGYLQAVGEDLRLKN
jgi:hypothetical protein